jgi:hypothetical protein
VPSAPGSRFRTSGVIASHSYLDGAHTLHPRQACKSAIVASNLNGDRRRRVYDERARSSMMSSSVPAASSLRFAPTTSSSNPGDRMCFKHLVVDTQRLCRLGNKYALLGRGGSESSILSKTSRHSMRCRVSHEISKVLRLDWSRVPRKCPQSTN